VSNCSAIYHVEKKLHCYVDEMNGWCVNIVVDKPFAKLDFYNAISLYSYNNNPRGDCPSTLSPSESTSVYCYFLEQIQI
jgi:hypothetical protein